MFPNNNPIGGMMISFTNDVTIFPNAPPMTTPTAMSTTLPFIANSLNSLTMLMAGIVAYRSRPAKSVLAGRLGADRPRLLHHVLDLVADQGLLRQDGLGQRLQHVAVA